MNKQQLLQTLEQLDMRPGRGLGQNFLLDGNLLDSIVRDADPRPGETILEVGPGLGALTRRLLKSGAEVVAIEFDRRLAEYLRQTIAHDAFRLIEADACKVDFSAILPADKPFRGIANLPYSISTVFIARMLELPRPPVGMFFMLQKEMAERLAAAPGCKAYGALTVRAQLLFDIQIRRLVPPEVFFPPPEVDSAIVGFTLKEALPEFELRRRIAGVVKTAFSQRRKQMCKVLMGCYDRDRVAAAFAATGLPPEIRPDRVSVADFTRLTREIFS